MRVKETESARDRTRVSQRAIVSKSEPERARESLAHKYIAYRVIPHETGRDVGSQTATMRGKLGLLCRETLKYGTFCRKSVVKAL